MPVVAPAPMVISGRWRGHGDRGLCGVGERGGVDDAAAFGDARRRRQADRGDVGDGFVRDGGADGGAAGNQVFEVAAADTGDAVGDGAAAGIDVVRRRGGDAAAGGTDADGDDFAVGQRDRDRAAGDGVGQSHGVGDQGAFIDAAARREDGGDGVDGVGDAGHGGSRVDGPGFQDLPPLAPVMVALTRCRRRCERRRWGGDADRAGGGAGADG